MRAMRSYYFCHNSIIKAPLRFLCKPPFNFSTRTSVTNPRYSIVKANSSSQEFANLLLEGVSENSSSFCKTVHGQTIVFGCHCDVFLGNILIHSYAKTSQTGNARLLFDRMPEKNLVSWSSLVSTYTKHGFNEEALLTFLEFTRTYSHNPNEFVLASVIRGCTQLGGVLEGAQLHGFTVKGGYDQDVYVGTSLVDFYSKNGDMEAARLLFDGLPLKSAVSWTTIITGHTRSGASEESLQLFNKMIESNNLPDKYVLTSVLNACSVLEFSEGGRQIHSFLFRRGIDMDVSVGNVLIDFYTKCGRVKTAREIFDRMGSKNVISWTTMIAGYMQNMFDGKAMKLFSEMGAFFQKPDGFACTSVLTSCGSAEALSQGKQVHAYTIKVNLESDVFVNNGLIDMYAKCNSIDDARRAFDFAQNRNVISYNAMIEGYSGLEELSQVLNLFHEMRLNSFSPTPLTFVSLLGASASLCSMVLSKQIHGITVKFGISFDLFCVSALIVVYSKCSCLKDASLVFKEVASKDIVVWNVMFFGYTLQSENEEALKLYQELQFSREKPNEFTFSVLITAASNLASLSHGQQLHNQIAKKGLDIDPIVGNALLEMYANCGSIKEANKMFNSITWKDEVCWNSMISTYAQHGEAEEALKLFEEMVMGSLKPNRITFIAVLSACSHVGRVEDGYRYFNSIRDFGLRLEIEHYACMVSLLSRAGRLLEAKELIENMPMGPAAIVWRSLLSACRNADDVELGKYAAEMAIASDPSGSGSHVLLSNLFASKGMWVDVERVREEMDFSAVVKKPGCSWIEVNNKVNVFVARDKSHHETELIFSVLDILTLQIRGACNVPEADTFLLNQRGTKFT